jgi:cardiolipin synthase
MGRTAQQAWRKTGAARAQIGRMQIRIRRLSPGAAARWLALSCCLAWMSGCLSYPTVPAGPLTVSAQRAQVSGARGPLSRQESAAILDRIRKESGADDILLRHVALEEAISGSPLVAGNKISLLQDGPATYKAMFEAIERARDHINLETYIFEDDEVGERFAAALLAKQKRGVQVNVIYDSVGSIKTGRAFFDRLRQEGIRVLEYGPVNPLAARKDYSLNSRDHRKILIVDGTVAFIGGINISSVYSSRPSSGRRPSPAEPKDVAWRDTHVRIEGPVTREFQKLFLDTWARQKGEPLPERRYYPPPRNGGNHLVRAIGSLSDDENSPIYVTLMSAVTNAETSIDITVAYFLPDPQLLGALTDAARRGVAVRLVLPSQSDFWAVFHAGRSRYADLLRAGVKIYERRASVLHAKTVVVDDVWSTIGSTNLDPRSFLHNDEVNAVVLGYDFAREMKAMFENDVKESDAITAEAWRRRPLGDRAREWGARLWEYWM